MSPVPTSFSPRPIKGKLSAKSWRAQYESYIRSDAWCEKRKLVLLRSRGWCEGCGNPGAVEVHHLTYEHLGREFLWELAAVCAVCHERLHPDAKADVCRCDLDMHFWPFVDIFRQRPPDIPAAVHLSFAEHLSRHELSLVERAEANRRLDQAFRR